MTANNPTLRTIVQTRDSQGLLRLALKMTYRRLIQIAEREVFGENEFEALEEMLFDL